MADKKQQNVLVNGQHVVYVDPTYGLRIPDAHEVADQGVVTNSQRVVGGDERLTVLAEDAAGLVQVGIARLKGAGD